MGDYNKRGDRGGFGGGDRPRFGGRPGGFGGDREFRKPAQMFSTICAECGKTCEVPFRPNGEKPVYCNLCFGKNKPSQGSSSGFGGSRFDAPKRDFSSSSRPAADNGQSDVIRKQLDVITSKLDILIKVISKREASNEVEADAIVSENSVKEVAVKTAVKAKKVSKKK